MTISDRKPIRTGIAAVDGLVSDTRRHTRLEWIILPTNSESLWRQPVLLKGKSDAILIDGGFTLSVGHLLVDAIRESGKTLRQIIVTCHDPDYYFSLGVVKKAFPDVPIAAPASIAAKIAETAQNKIDVWRTRLGEDGPQSLADLALPEPLDGPDLSLEGISIKVVTAQQPLNYHLWLPDARAILGGVQISGANHVWMADTPRVEDRAPWIADLEAMLARNVLSAPPGHAPPGSPDGPAAIRDTRDYIRAFDEEQSRATSSDALITGMRRRYPDLGMDFILELGAQVCMGEKNWP